MGPAKIGPNAWIFQNVTIGGRPGKAGGPRIGADARIYAGAVIAGPIQLGEGVVVGANAVVARDVPDGGKVTVAVEYRASPDASRPADA